MNMMDDSKKEDYQVGWGKPPKSGQFRKGVSGNPSGRPRKGFDLEGTLVSALSAPITIIDKGKRKTVSKFEAAMMNLANKFVSGDPKAMRLVLEYRRASRERAAAMNERSPFDPLYARKFTAKDLSDDELAEFILTGELKSLKMVERKSKRRAES